MPSDLLALAQQFLPAYLLPGAREQLLKQINEFPHERGYYTSIDDPAYLQGDRWSGFVVFDFDSGAKREVKGLIISNSCDVSPNNSTGPGQRIVFAPLVRMSAYIDLLKADGRDEGRITSMVDRIKRQHVDNVFYLPEHGDAPAALVLLDNLHSEPLASFWAATKTRITRLSDFGFWLFVLKLSIHFTRLREEVQRNSVL